MGEKTPNNYYEEAILQGDSTPSQKTIVGWVEPLINDFSILTNINNVKPNKLTCINKHNYSVGVQGLYPDNR